MLTANEELPILPSPDTHDYMPGFIRAPLIDTEEQTLIDELPSGKILTTNSGGNIWRTEVSYPEWLTEQEKRTIEMCIYQAKRTEHRAIEVYLPQYNTARVFGDINSCKVVYKGSNKISITGTKGLQGNPWVGDTFRLSNHTKVYKITTLTKNEDDWDITFYPALYVSKEDFMDEKVTIQLNNVPFTLVLMNATEIMEDINSDGVWELAPLQFREQPLRRDE